MKVSPKNWSSLIRRIIETTIVRSRARLIFAVLIAFNLSSRCQIANYVSNGGFENVVPSATNSPFDAVYYWDAIDSSATTAYYVFATAPTIGNAPYCSTGFQYPRTGNGFILSQFCCIGGGCGPTNSVQYPRNRLKQTLQPGKTYCAKYYVVNTNNNRVAIENYGMYFGSSLLDTITYCNTPLTYITPQIEYNNGIIADTLNWTCISGTFTAVGNEKYMIIGNFNSAANTNTTQLNTPLNPQSADIYIDDVSCIPLDLPAYAGPDIWGIPTTTVYLGRQQDVGIDEACIWYKLPNTTNAIDTAAGITITVAATTETYMVKQDICGIIKYDTVVVHPSAVSLNEKLKMENEELTVFPNPAQNELNLEFTSGIAASIIIAIYNSTGQLLRKEDIILKNKTAKINTIGFQNGVYFIIIHDNESRIVNKRFVIAR